MRTIKSQKGSALIGLLIVMVIAVMLIFGYRFMGRDSKNQIEQGRDAIDQAEEAAQDMNETNSYIQSEVNGGQADVNYHGIQNNLKGIR